MSNPQQPELARSRKTPSQDQDAVAGVVEGQRQPGTEGPSGPVPPDNQPGHHPAEEQDKPDLEAFAARLGITDSPPDNGAAATGPPTADPTARPATSPSPGRSTHAPSPSPAPRGNRRMARLATAAGLLVAALLIRRRRRSRRS